MIEDEKKIYNSLMKELQQEWENEQITHSRVRLTKIGIKSSQISALVNLLIKKGILKPGFKIKKGERVNYRQLKLAACKSWRLVTALRRNSP